MEYHDKMKRNRIKRGISIVVFMVLGIILIWGINLKKGQYGSSLISDYGFILLLIVSEGLFLYLLYFEFAHPNFIITENEIVLSNLAPKFLLRKKGFVYSISYDEIKHVNIFADTIYIGLKNSSDSLSIDQRTLDNYELAKSNLLIMFAKKNIPVNQS